MRQLNLQNLELVSGGFGQVGVAVGTVMGAAFFVGERLDSGQGNYVDFAKAVGTGAAIGFASDLLAPTVLRAGAAGLALVQRGLYSGMAARGAESMLPDIPAAGKAGACSEKFVSTDS